MARREITQYFDDLDDTLLQDDEVNTIRFSVDGSHYMLDLSDKNAADFRAALAPWISVAQPITAPQRNTRRSGTRPNESRAIREWARAQGMEVSDRGKVPGAIVDAYRQAQGN